MKHLRAIPRIIALTGACAIVLSCSRSESAVDSRCAEIERRYDAVLAAAPGRCAGDADCACYGQVTTRSRCGGVTDRKSAAALEAIAKEFFALKCPRHYRCAAWKCVPACLDGTCVTGQLKRMMEGVPNR
ncbi:MAG TPA: hypothetical protein PKY31_00400 [Spirochaetota bacterium]|nr:hypothetical protein [Spirochaetota bacterium]